MKKEMEKKTTEVDMIRGPLAKKTVTIYSSHCTEQHSAAVIQCGRYINCRIFWQCECACGCGNKRRDCGAAILRARGDSRYPFIALTVSGILNVVLNLILVVVFHLGVAGVAIAGSTIAMNFEYFAYYGITAFGQTATTFTSQNYVYFIF